MNTIPALVLTDFYKTDHRRQFPDGTTTVYSNFTPRGSRIADIDHVVFFGLQYFVMEYLQRRFTETFFAVPKEQAVGAYRRRLDTSLGKGAVPMDHVEALHDLGHLPLRIKALPEGTRVPMQVPTHTIENTDPRFAWLTNFIETMMSAVVWGPCTAATIANRYRRVFEHWAKQTGSPREFVPWQGHDFSFRGMYGIEAACVSGAGHLLSFTGTDTIPAIDFLEQYYGADSERELIGGSVPATEHAVMCAGGKETEIETYRRLLTTVYPRGIVSVVSDTWDFFRVITDLLPALKREILARDGKLVIRPDSGDPVAILVGDPAAPAGSPERAGLIELLWQQFGGSTTKEGYRVLDPHVGAIYGDSITLERQQAILQGLAHKGFASCNVVLGIGSYTYQHVTRDTFGFAMKATFCTVNGEDREIYKQPRTDSKKNSHRGLIAVRRDERGELRAHFPVTRAEEASRTNLLEPVFENGKLLRTQTLAGIRAIVERELTS
ncbi:MAG: nicotinate phosphoribosyltransferase [Planctomycetes bacterium]|nr:nicotinate phosphoribosyltransferase [Planctomycetota bacterium]